MERTVTGAAIRRLREGRSMTQEELAARIHVTGKAVSKWETGQGLPDISLLEPLAEALGVSVLELMSGADVRNRNRAADMTRVCFYVCPSCGNVIQAAGEAVVSCCGLALTPLAAQPPDPDHPIRVGIVEDEYYVTVAHPMRKDHHISFLAAVSDRRVQLVRLYPEEPAEARFRIERVAKLYAYCTEHGLFWRRPD